MHPPVAKRIPRATEIHGVTLSDDYYWLRDRDNPDVTAYLEAENAFAYEWMRRTGDLQQRLYDEMLARIVETDLSVPYRFGSHLYYSRTQEGKQYSILCRRADGEQPPEEIVLDLNELAQGHEFLSLGSYEVSDDGRCAAYSLDTTGARDYTLYVKDLLRGTAAAEPIAAVDSVAWSRDGATLFYTVQDHAKRPHQLFRHQLGTSRHDLLYEETDPLFVLYVYRSRSQEYLFAASASSTSTEVRYLRASEPAGEFTLVTPRSPDHEYYVDHHGDHFYVRTNREAMNFKLTRAIIGTSDASEWSDVLAPDEAVVLEDFDLFEDHCVLSERVDGLGRLRVLRLSDSSLTTVDFGELAYALSPGANREFRTRSFRVHYQSFVTPETVLEIDLDNGRHTILKTTEVRGGHDPARYVTERRFATAADGAQIPISLVRRREVLCDGTAPLLLYGYGAYGLPLEATFNPNRLSLLDRGMIFAVAHVRGGGERGRAWHDAGRMQNKMNSFTDFVASAEELVRLRYTAAGRLIIQGGSAGGLLVAASTNLRPDLFHSVVAHVPFVDVLNTMLDPSLPLTLGEYLEWGNPTIPEQFDWIRAYSPYEHLRPTNYPAMLVRIAINDSQVPYWEGAKYVASLRAVKTDQNDQLLVTNTGAGHGGSSGRYDKLREIAFDYAFILAQAQLT